VKDVDDVVRAICSFPVDYGQGGASPRDLLARTGYPPRQGQITPEQIEAYLREHPLLVDAWRQYSDDIRHSPAWYFTKADLFTESDRNRWQVGLYDDGHHQVRVLDDKVEACALFVIRTFDQMIDPVRGR
jgi:hypothetical protein